MTNPTPLVPEHCGLPEDSAGMSPIHGSVAFATAAGSTAARSWRVAKSITKLFEQVNVAAPNRSRATDGTIGDRDHQNRASDHNPHVTDSSGVGVVTAGDITHDPGDNCDCAKITEALGLSRDSRIKYVIFNGRLFSSYPSGNHPAWTWRAYTGPNPHASHFHISVQPTQSLYDSTAPWSIGISGGNDMPDDITANTLTAKTITTDTLTAKTIVASSITLKSATEQGSKPGVDDDKQVAWDWATKERNGKTGVFPPTKNPDDVLRAEEFANALRRYHLNIVVPAIEKAGVVGGIKLGDTVKLTKP